MKVKIGAWGNTNHAMQCAVTMMHARHMKTSASAEGHYLQFGNKNARLHRWQVEKVWMTEIVLMKKCSYVTFILFK